MIKLSPTTYISFLMPINYNLVWAGWDYTICFWGLFIVYQKSLLK